MTRVTIPLCLGMFILPRWGRAFNLLTRGEREAQFLGVETERVRLTLIALTALLTGLSVAVCGAVGFVGLVVPHLLRLIIGPDHRRLLPASALSGAALLTTADLVARTVAAPLEIPLGVVTSSVGGPFFLWLLGRTRREHGGWGWGATDNAHRAPMAQTAGDTTRCTANCSPMSAMNRYQITEAMT